MLAKVAELQDEFEAEKKETLQAITIEEERIKSFQQQQVNLARSRKADTL
jgi:hypothetical protein